MTQLLATLVPAMFEAWNKVPLPSISLAPKRVYHHVSSFTFHSQAEVSYVHRKVNQLLIRAAQCCDTPPQATCRALVSMPTGDKIARTESEVRTSCDMVQKASTELECMRAREALKRRCAILNTRIESLQVYFALVSV